MPGGRRYWPVPRASHKTNAGYCGGYVHVSRESSGRQILDQESQKMTTKTDTKEAIPAITWRWTE
jgi:hypothetical protein